MRKTNVEPPAKAKATTKSLKREGASTEEDDRSLNTIQEEENSSLPEVTGSDRTEHNTPSDEAIIRSFDTHQEAFLTRLMQKAGQAMGQEHQQALLRHQDRRPY